ncbi:MAG TPA: response regulator [Rhodocyclaceae bacterium]
MTNIDTALAAVCAKLDDAWQQLAGVRARFAPVDSFNVDGSRGHYALTPIHVPGKNLTGGVALNLPANVANQLAARLFGLAESEVDANMRADVCAEISNILCSCVTGLFGPAEEIELGVTLSATHEDMRNVFVHNTVRCILGTASGCDSVTLVVVDSFALKPASSPAALAPIMKTLAEERNRMKFLIVDDSRAIQAIVRRAVEKAGLDELEIKTAMSGAEALKTCETWLPDMVITDWHMPGMTGIELIKALKQKHADLRVGFVTTESSIRNLDEAKQCGAAFVLRKPFADDELVSAVRKALETQASSPSLMPGSVRRGSVGSLTAFLDQSTGVSSSLVVAAPCPLPSIPVPWAIGLYAESGKNDVRGFCLLDRNAILLLGGAGTGMSHANLHASLGGGDIPSPVFAKASELLTKGASTMFLSGDGQPIVLARSQLVPQPPEKLIEIMSKSSQRIDYNISHSGLPSGRIVVITR